MSDPAYSSWIHKWVTLCPRAIQLDLSHSNNFVLRVSTGPGIGSNDFLLRSGLSLSPDPSRVDVSLSSNLVNLSADKNLAIHNSYGDSNTRFAITQVPANYAGQHVQMQFFDIGDSVSRGASGTLKLTSDANMIGSDGGCTYMSASGSSSSTTAGSCTVAVDSNNNGRLFTIDWHVPSDYSCLPTSSSSSGGCWLYVNMTFPGVSDLDDTTTWTLDMPGTQLRLINQ